MSVEAIRAVVDTQVILRAIVNLHSLPAKVVFGLQERYQLIISDDILAEVRDVLYRPKIRAKFPHLTDVLAERMLERLGDGERIGVDEVAEVSRDSKDDIFLACAKFGRATYIVSEDKDLLVLHPYENIQIVNVLEFSRLFD